MKRLVSADNLLIATLWQRLLEGAGVRCEIRNRYLSTALGELPVDATRPEIWVLNGRDLPYAATLMAELQCQPRLAAWSCPVCGEGVEGQFLQCWRCLAKRACD